MPDIEIPEREDFPSLDERFLDVPGLGKLTVVQTEGHLSVSLPKLVADSPA